MNINRINKKHPFILLSILYLISNILLLFVHGIFWDDWTLYHDTKAIEQQFFHGNGAIFLGYTHIFLQELACNTILLYRILILLIGWGCVLSFYKILKTSFKIDDSASFYIAALYATFPLGYAHMTMICLPYQIGLLLQLIAIQLFITSKNKFNIGKYALFFLIQFSASLFLVSNVVFWGGLLLFFAIQATWKKFVLSFKYISIVLKKMMAWFIYYIPCVVFWIIRTIYFMPTGSYQADGYNSFSLYKLVSIPGNFLKSLINIIIYITQQIFDIVNTNLLILVWLIICVIITCLLKSKKQGDNLRKTTHIHFITLFMLYTFAIAAYLAVGLTPIYNCPSDRHAILIILIICSLIYYSIELIISNKFKRYVLILALSSMSTYSFSQYWEAIYQSQRNDAIKFFFEETILPEGNIIVNEDNSNIKTGSCFYSWSAIYYHATGKQNRCFATSNNTEFYDTTDYLTQPYHQKDAKSGKPTIEISIMNEKEARNNISILKNFLYYYFQQTKYKDAIKNKFNIQYNEI